MIFHLCVSCHFAYLKQSEEVSEVPLLESTSLCPLKMETNL